MGDDDDGNDDFRGRFMVVYVLMVGVEVEDQDVEILGILRTLRWRQNRVIYHRWMMSLWGFPTLEYTTIF